MKSKKTDRQQTIRIIAGEYRHRQISVIDASDLRPTGARIRETLFNWLAPIITGKSCLDLFAGSGILGLEALSRGAKQVTFIEKNRAVVKQLEKTCKQLNITQAHIVHADYNDALQGQYDVIFLDPPYTLNLLPQLLTQIKQLSPQYVFIEDNRPFEQWINQQGGYRILKSKKAGGIYYGLLSPHQA